MNEVREELSIIKSEIIQGNYNNKLKKPVIK